MTATGVGSIAERGWIRSRWAVPTLLAWQASAPTVELLRSMPAIACAPALWAPKKQSATQPTTGWATRKATRVVRARLRERRG